MNTKVFAKDVPKISLDMPREILDDLRAHVGDEHKFISIADAVRTACRRLLDHLDAIDDRHGRRKSTHINADEEGGK